MIDAAALTFDIDWAPDWAIEQCAELCDKHSVSATFFATHDSAATRSLLRQDRFEVGIHPNFLPASSHGRTEIEVLEHCIGIVPTARVMRTHGLVQSSALLALIADRFPQIEIDVSLFLPGHADLRPVEAYVGASGRRLIRLPYYWEDDVMALDPRCDWTRPPPASGGLKIFNFHPALVALNLADYGQYRELKRRLGARPLTGATEAEFASLVNSGRGARTYITDVVAAFGAGRFMRLTDIAATFNSATRRSPVRI